MIELLVGDVTKVRQVDVIVNAANGELRHGTGVCDAVFQAAGPEKLAAACQAIMASRKGQPIETSDFVATGAFDLSKRGVKSIFHAVGPVYKNYPRKEAEQLLYLVHRKMFDYCEQAGHRSIALPAISTGVFGFPVEEAAPIAIDAATRYPYDIRILFVLWPDKFPVYERALTHHIANQEP